MRAQYKCAQLNPTWADCGSTLPAFRFSKCPPFFVRSGTQLSFNGLPARDKLLAHEGKLAKGSNEQQSENGDDYTLRRQFTFSQAEGLVALPGQLQLGELSSRLRARLFKVIIESYTTSRQSHDFAPPTISGDWYRILYDKFIYHDDGFAVDWRNDFVSHREELTKLFKYGLYNEIFDFVQFVLRHKDCPLHLGRRIEWAFESSYAAYRLVGGDTIVPAVTEAEGETIARAFVDLSGSTFNGARAHLRNAGENLTRGDWASSVRESVHCVEAVARVLAPGTKELGAALNQLSKFQHIHTAMSDGFKKLYGYASDEKGIRHPLLTDSSAKVDEGDALYMFGACAAFVTYLVRKATIAGLIK